MSVMDEFRKEREAIKDKSFREKLSYYVYYYKWHTVAVVAIVSLLVAIVWDMAHYKEIGFYGIFLNAYTTSLESTEEFAQEFMEYSDFDSEEYDIDFEHTFRMGETMDDAGLSASQTIMVYIAAADVDVMTMDTFNFNKYAYNDIYADLRDYLTEEQLENYKDYLFYIDKAYLEEMKESVEDTSLTYEYAYPAHDDPDSMTEPIPVGINLKYSEKFNEYYSYQGEDAFIGIVLNTEYPERCKQMLSFLFEENE